MSAAGILSSLLLSVLFLVIALTIVVLMYVFQDNFVNASIASNPHAVYLCNILGCLCFCITAMTFVARSNQLAPKQMDLIAAVTWLMCAYMDHSHKALFKDQSYKINMGLEIGLGVAFLYQYSTRGGKSKKN